MARSDPGAAERIARFRQRRQEQGQVLVQVWVPAEAAQFIRDVAASLRPGYPGGILHVAGDPRPASENQIAWTLKICAEKSLPFPEEARGSFLEMYRWIAANRYDDTGGQITMPRAVDRVENGLALAEARRIVRRHLTEVDQMASVKAAGEHMDAILTAARGRGASWQTCCSPTNHQPRTAPSWARSAFGSSIELTPASIIGAA